MVRYAPHHTPRRGRRKLGIPDDPRGIYAGGETQKLRAEVRIRLKNLIIDATGDPHAAMWYTPSLFYHKLHKGELLRLLDFLKDGSIYFYEVSDWEYYAYANDVEGVAPGKFEGLGSLHSGRSDVKKSRFDKVTGQPISTRRRLRRTGVKTPKYL
ncbi:hypothetical protein BD309DRAFT_1080999 [Dichomitus squalens]|uniref:Uncharacterized protein n=2 Tax=Dichomitus squalens TaxID=114155 RepID=A0A4Q9NNI7_9APHY|nr:uncharacterized protein DICSQDRAFT_175580 [Dichomitus squalens LYAD-421 SS1]EJF55731.1 hypothetical protein DICSQDRAFT_175580 [Dichomitus squalens LYAD-421 SS1]TBU23841.1 hypothetical protein BD311DRAFT_781418 [Dichomitus squalens]TBU43049.1 hypothetical protein BD309DRAFT_1080999 [Dichomitus squalens]TBU53145.1 hypothetical protein BD310DRAFT_1042602 [Dichomitus squalens]